MRIPRHIMRLQMELRRQQETLQAHEAELSALRATQETAAQGIARGDYVFEGLVDTKEQQRQEERRQQQLLKARRALKASAQVSQGETAEVPQDREGGAKESADGEAMNEDAKLDDIFAEIARESKTAPRPVVDLLADNAQATRPEGQTAETEEVLVSGTWSHNTMKQLLAPGHQLASATGSRGGPRAKKVLAIDPEHDATAAAASEATNSASIPEKTDWVADPVQRVTRHLLSLHSPAVPPQSAPEDVSTQPLRPISRAAPDGTNPPSSQQVLLSRRVVQRLQRQARTLVQEHAEVHAEGSSLSVVPAAAPVDAQGAPNHTTIATSNVRSEFDLSELIRQEEEEGKEGASLKRKSSGVAMSADANAAPAKTANDLVEEANRRNFARRQQRRLRHLPPPTTTPAFTTSLPSSYPDLPTQTQTLNPDAQVIPASGYPGSRSTSSQSAHRPARFVLQEDAAVSVGEAASAAVPFFQALPRVSTAVQRSRVEEDLIVHETTDDDLFDDMFA